MKSKKTRFWRLTALGADRLAVVDERLLAGATASSIADLIVKKWGVYAEDIESGELKLDSFIRQISRYKKSVKKKQIVPVDQPTQVAVREDQRPDFTATVPNSHVANIREQIAQQEQAVADLREKIAKENSLVAKVLRQDLGREIKTLDSLYRTLTAAKRGDDQHMRGRDRSHLFQTDEALQKSIAFEVGVLERQQVHELMPEFFRALQWQPGDPDAPPELARELTGEDARTIRNLARKYGV